MLDPLTVMSWVHSPTKWKVSINGILNQCFGLESWTRARVSAIQDNGESEMMMACCQSATSLRWFFYVWWWWCTCPHKFFFIIRAGWRLYNSYAGEFGSGWIEFLVKPGTGLLFFLSRWNTFFIITVLQIRLIPLPYYNVSFSFTFFLPIYEDCCLERSKTEREFWMNIRSPFTHVSRRQPWLCSNSFISPSSKSFWRKFWRSFLNFERLAPELPDLFGRRYPSVDYYGCFFLV